MPLPHLHIFHPPESVASHIIHWLAEVQGVLQADANWDGCVWSRTAYTQQAGFNIGTAADLVIRNPGPAIFIQKVQAKLLARFREVVRRDALVYSISPTCCTDIWETCEEARQAYENGEPRIPVYELIAFLIISKLAKQDKWGGTSRNKNFLWAEDLPKGGFPKNILGDREIMHVADALFNAGVLTRKRSGRQQKYGLGNAVVVQHILESAAFTEIPRSLRNYFDRSPRQVPARLLKYNED